MRKKIEELRNREEGFTLVELLAVIVILGIIVAIAIPAIGSVMDKASSKANDAEKALVADAARLYVTTNREEVTFDTNPEKITVTTLKDKGYLEERAASKLKGGVEVTRSGTEGNYSYEYDASSVEKDDSPAGP